MLLQALCSISYPFVNSNWSYSPETPNLGQIRRFLEPCDLEIWRMTLKNNRAPLLSNIKLYASFDHHMWIQTGVTVRKRLSWVVTSVTLTFDLWPWRFAWTLRWSLVITPENFMMIRWWEHSQKGVTDRRTDGQTDRRTDRQTENTICRAAWSQLKIIRTRAKNCLSLWQFIAYILLFVIVFILMCEIRASFHSKDHLSIYIMRPPDLYDGNSYTAKMKLHPRLLHKAGEICADAIFAIWK